MMWVRDGVGLGCDGKKRRDAKNILFRGSVHYSPGHSPGSATGVHVMHRCCLVVLIQCNTSG